MNALNVILPAPLARKVSPHGTVVFLGVLGSFIYRDIWPLVTYTLVPIDRTGPVLWTEVALTAVGALLPVFEPYPFVPVDPLVSQLDLSEKTQCLSIRWLEPASRGQPRADC
jgi:hypothetical protein